MKLRVYVTNEGHWEFENNFGHSLIVPNPVFCGLPADSVQGVVGFSVIADTWRASIEDLHRISITGPSDFTLRGD